MSLQQDRKPPDSRREETTVLPTQRENGLMSTGRSQSSSYEPPAGLKHSYSFLALSFPLKFFHFANLTAKSWLISNLVIFLLLWKSSRWDSKTNSTLDTRFHCKYFVKWIKKCVDSMPYFMSLTLSLPQVTKTELLLTISIQYQPDKWWEWRKISIWGLVTNTKFSALTS